MLLPSEGLCVTDPQVLCRGSLCKDKGPSDNHPTSISIIFIKRSESVGRSDRCDGGRVRWTSGERRARGHLGGPLDIQAGNWERRRVPR